MIIKNYFKITIRQLWRNPAYTVICVVGLAIGLAIGMMALSYSVRELSWETCHVNHERVQRVEMRYQHGDTTNLSARVMGPLGAALVEQIPGVRQAAVFRHRSGVSLRIDKRTYQAGNLIFAGPEFFDVFSFELKSGRLSVLDEPDAVLIADSIAKVYFPDENPIGKTIVLDKQYELVVQGILEDTPPLTQLHCDFIASYATLRSMGENVDSWTEGGRDLTYLLFDETANPEMIEGSIGGVFSRHVPEEISKRYTFSLQPLDDIYFNTYYSGNRGEIWPGFEWDVLFIVLGVGLFILIQAIANFISLSTARAVDRMKEVGIRKTFGAVKSQLVTQFLGESMVITIAGAALGLWVFEFFRRGYQTVTPDKYELPSLYGDATILSLTAALVIVVGLVAGFYPALYLSRFKPMSILKNDGSSGPSKSLLRKALVVFQFTLAIFFIIETVGNYQQMNYLTNYDLGFERENTMVLRFQGDDAARDCALAKNEILARNNVLTASRGGQILGGRVGTELYYTNPERKESDIKLAKEFVVDFDFVSMYGLKIQQGRDFSRDRPEDINHSILISESMRQHLELDNPLGYQLHTDSSTYEVIGVVDDFHGTALDWSYRNTSVIVLNPDRCRVLCVKLPSEDISGSVAAIGSTWDRIFNDRVFEYTFLDDYIISRYEEIDSISTFFGVLSIISIVLACLGTFGLVLYTVQRKTKDIAIRKILGASISAIMKVLTKDFVYLIVLANVIACPFAYLMLTWTLEYYPIRAALGPMTYMAGGVLTLLIALMVSAYHVTRAARANPADTLRYE